MNYIRPGMELARNVYHADGRILLREGITISEVFINKLKEAGIYSLYIKDDLSGDVDIVDAISEEARRQSLDTIRDAYVSLEKKAKIDTQIIKATIDRILEEILSNRDVLLSICDISSIDDYTMVHSVNVCIMSVMIGVSMMLNEKDLRDLGIGALLHDIGKASIDQNVAHKPRIDLVDVEEDEFRRHTDTGFEILRRYQGISLLSAHVAFQHHENWDGSGFPRQLTGDRILNFARIVAVADTYDRLMDERYYKPPLSSEEAVDMIRSMAGKNLDPAVVEALMAHVAVYPTGSLVELNGIYLAIVIEQNNDKPGSPIVKMIFDKSIGQRLEEQVVDLSTKKTIRITKLLKEEEIQQIFYGGGMKSE